MEIAFLKLKQTNKQASKQTNKQKTLQFYPTWFQKKFKQIKNQSDREISVCFEFNSGQCDQCQILTFFKNPKNQHCEPVRGKKI